MYQPLLTRRYLLSKVMPLLAALAVALCTAMVLVVWSVMGGFLNSLLAQGRGMIGDVSIEGPVSGIPYYRELVDELEADPLVGAATPTVQTFGLLGLEDGDLRFITCIGVDPQGYDTVTGFFDRLWWRPIAEPLPRDRDGNDLRLDPDYTLGLERILAEGQRLEKFDPDTRETRPAMVLGIQVTRYNARRPAGYFDPIGSRFGPTQEYTVGTLPLSRSGNVVDIEYRKLPVANEFQSGMYEIDAGWVILPLDLMQSMMGMSGGGALTEPGYRPRLEPNADGEMEVVEPRVIGEEPARVTGILLRASEGVTPAELEPRVEEIYERFARGRNDEIRAGRFVGPEVPILPGWREYNVYQWEDKPGLSTFIGAVKKETALVLVLFGFISLTAVFLVCAIFWSMVSEKTRDIGVLRAIGASRGGVAWLFLRYGMSIGVVGSVAGGLLAFVIVRNINPIHEWLGSALGIVVWDPSVYYFTEIPNDVEATKAAFVLVAGVLFSVLGALLPAARAAWMDPVRALRFE